MKIGELAKLTDIPSSTIRFYEQKGLMPSPKRLASGYRKYDNSAVEQLQLIKFSQSLGFTLDELPSLMDREAGFDHDLIMSRLKEKLGEVDALLNQLNQKKKTLSSLIHRLDKRWDTGECMPQNELAEIIEDAEL